MMHQVGGIFLFDCLKNRFFVLGAPRVWYLFILATDNGNPQRQCKCDKSEKLFYPFSFSAFCNLRINLVDVNDNPPGRNPSLNKIFII